MISEASEIYVELIVSKVKPPEKPIFKGKSYNDPYELCRVATRAFKENKICAFRDENGEYLTLHNALIHLGVENPQMLISEYEEINEESVRLLKQITNPGIYNIICGVIVLVCTVILIGWGTVLTSYFGTLHRLILVICGFSFYIAYINKKDAHLFVWGFIMSCEMIYLLITAISLLISAIKLATF